MTAPGKPAPGIHALLIGVSDYPALPDDDVEMPVAHHLGLQKLTSPALTVARIYEWLQKRRGFLPLPLASCQVLVSPSSGESPKSKHFATWPTRARLAEVVSAIVKWRDDLSSDPSNIGLFYFAGHGVKRDRRDDVLLLEEFGSNKHRVLQYAIDSTSLVNGMAPSKEFPNIGRTQLYFFDACRVRPKLFRDYEDVPIDAIWDRTQLEKDDRSMLVIFTTEAGAKAYSPPNDQSLFSRALIECLDGASAEPFDAAMKQWGVTGLSLASYITTELDRVNQQYKQRQTAEVARTPSRRVVLNRLERPPAVDVTLKIDPDAARACTQVQILAGDKPVLDVPYPVAPLPFRGTLNAGMYRITSCDPSEVPQWQPNQWIMQARPRAIEWPLEIAPLAAAQQPDGS